MAFHQQLQEVRRKAGLTQEEFAEVLQVSRQAVSKWESGRGYPEMEKILYICNRYHVSMATLFAEEAPTETAQTIPVPEDAPALPRSTLHDALSAFTGNLSPKNRLLGFATLLGCAVLALLIGACLRGGTYDMTLYIWIGVIVIFGIVEAATAGLTSIWFVLGGVAGLLGAVCGGGLWVQIALFFVISILALIFTRPLVKKLTANSVQPTNLDLVIGQTARVTEAIDNTIPTGEVYVQGKTWSARSESGAPIAVDEMVTVTRMSGVKLFVTK